MASRGTVNSCPVCRTSLSAPDWASEKVDEPWGLFMCPRCDAPLWSLSFSVGSIFFVRQSNQTIYELFVELSDDEMRPVFQSIADGSSNADSMDIVELALLLEETIDRHIDIDE